MIRELNNNQQIPGKLTYDEMLIKLDNLYGEKEKIELALANIKYDIEFLETMIMFKFNKEQSKKKEWQS